MDIVLHSASKYLGGHSDVIAGLVVTKDDQLAEKNWLPSKCHWWYFGPSGSWLLQRGINVVSSMRAHLANAEAVFNYLSNQPLVSKIYYPGDPNNPDYEVAKKQMHGFAQ